MNPILAAVLLALAAAAETAGPLPAPGEPVTFAVLGAAGGGGEAQGRVASALEGLDCDLVLVAGGAGLPRGRARDYEAGFLAPYAGLRARLPVFPAVGAEAYGGKRLFRGWEEARFRSGYARLMGRPRFYSFDAGDAHFAALDTNAAGGIRAAAALSEGSDQLAWLRGDLARTKARWRFVFMDAPVRPLDGSGPDGGLWRLLRDDFFRGKVDMAFQGRGRFYARARTVEGTYYFTVGTAGPALEPPEKPEPSADRTIASHGLLLVSVDGAEAWVRFLDAGGRVLDSVRVGK